MNNKFLMGIGKVMLVRRRMNNMTGSGFLDINIFKKAGFNIHKHFVLKKLDNGYIYPLTSNSSVYWNSVETIFLTDSNIIGENESQFLVPIPHTFDVGDYRLEEDVRANIYYENNRDLIEDKVLEIEHRHSISWDNLKSLKEFEESEDDLHNELLFRHAQNNERINSSNDINNKLLEGMRKLRIKNK